MTNMTSYNEEQILNLMKERRSVRSFKQKEIEPDKLEKILEAARWSQSANNAQPWRLIVIKDRSTLKKLSKAAPYGRFIQEAPLALAIVADKGRSPKWYLHDTCILSHQVCLMAWALGIGTCWIGSMNREKGAKILDLEKKEYLTTVLPLGYPKGNPGSSD